MKPIIEKLPLSDDSSFVARTYRTPHFEVPWHQHIEYELILFTDGEGTSFIGNHVGEFKTGDIFFLGSNLPHTFQKAIRDLSMEAVVIQFREDFWGSDFLHLPECKSLRQLFEVSMKGLKLTGETKRTAKTMIHDIERLSGLRRITQLCDCLQLIAEGGDYETVSTQDTTAFNSKKQERIDRIFRFTIDHFQDTITLNTVAAHADMSVPAFCNYFRKSTKKTYIDFLNEIRIGHACQQLIDTQKPVQEICFESGFNTLANFNKQFLKIKTITPSAYRKKRNLII
ncbi:MAG TPA: AraC family transcriptional regulator [Chitinophagaceae bacterium]|jgi:AraC-like DNA-binding protein/quercetin dioxygenase-like cupin family protein|nr:AraC family transcriptional regulator [Chitinophagaceae bacterium]